MSGGNVHRSPDEQRRRERELAQIKRERRRRERAAQRAEQRPKPLIVRIVRAIGGRRRSDDAPAPPGRGVRPLTMSSVWSDAAAAAVPARARRRLTQRQRELLRKRVRVVGAGLLVVLAVVAWVQIPKLGVFRIDHVEVTGASAVPDLLVRNRLRDELANATFFDLDADRIERRVEELPFVRDADVDRHFPSGVSISVSEYQPLALGLGRGGTGAFLVARDGRVLARAQLTDWLGRVPVVRLSTEGVRPGVRVGGEAALKLLRAMPTTFPGTVRGVEVGPQNCGTPPQREICTLVAYMDDGPQIRVGRDDDLPTKLQVAQRLLGLYGPTGMRTIQYIDVSAPERPALKRGAPVS